MYQKADRSSDIHHDQGFSNKFLCIYSMHMRQSLLSPLSKLSALACLSSDESKMYVKLSTVI